LSFLRVVGFSARKDSRSSSSSLLAVADSTVGLAVFVDEGFFFFFVFVVSVVELFSSLKEKT